MSKDPQGFCEKRNDLPFWQESGKKKQNHRPPQLAIYIASAIMGALALKNGFNAHTHAYNALRTHFGNFYSWPLRPGDLWPCSLYDHAEILHAFQVS